MENVVACDLNEVKNNGKSVFRIVYFSQNAHEFKHYDFETDADDAGEKFSVFFFAYSNLSQQTAFFTAKSIWDSQFLVVSWLLFASLPFFFFVDISMHILHINNQEPLYCWWSFPLFSIPYCLIQGWYCREKLYFSQPKASKGSMIGQQFSLMYKKCFFNINFVVVVYICLFVCFARRNSGTGQSHYQVQHEWEKIRILVFKRKKIWQKKIFKIIAIVTRTTEAYSHY